MDNAGPEGAIFFEIVGCWNFSEAKNLGGLHSFTEQRAMYFSKTEQPLQQNGPSSPRLH